MDDLVVLQKLESLRRCISRIEEKTPSSLVDLESDLDRQDIIAVNLERAVQVCVDIAFHVISLKNELIPETMAQSFYTLEKMGILDKSIATRMAKSVGFRNTAVHAYQSIDWAIVYQIITCHLNDFREFARQVVDL